MGRDPLTDDIAERERKKYEAVWGHSSYRKIAPGVFETEAAFEAMGCLRGETLNDFGAGTGRAAKWFEDQGLTVRAIDFAANALEENVPSLTACLWELTEDDLYGILADYGFCTDVMEHIPPEKVDDVLANIAKATRKFVWFRIATRRDVMGERLVGEPLHLTIKDGDWWTGKLQQHFDFVSLERSDGRDAVFLCMPGDDA